MMMSLQRLSQMLDEHYGIPPIIIIDEYDTPIQQGHMRGFYDKVNSILDNQYSGYFGFTPEEVKAIAHYYHAEEKYAEICAWYDGYRFGDSEIFNPWYVINYFSNGCQPKTFWQSTGSNEIIGEVLAHAGEDIYERLNALLQGESFLTYIDAGVFLVAGYLKVVRGDSASSGDYMCEVALPNRKFPRRQTKTALRDGFGTNSGSQVRYRYNLKGR